MAPPTSSCQNTQPSNHNETEATANIYSSLANILRLRDYMIARDQFRVDADEIRSEIARYWGWLHMAPKSEREKRRSRALFSFNLQKLRRATRRLEEAQAKVDMQSKIVDCPLTNGQASRTPEIRDLNSAPRTNDLASQLQGMNLNEQR